MHLLDGLMHENVAQRTSGHYRVSEIMSADSTPARARGSRPNDFDLVELRPVLPRDEQPLGSRIVSDAVQDGFAAARALRIELGEVDETEHLAVHGRNTRDAIVVPDVGPDLAVDVLELVQSHERHAVAAHLDLTRNGKRLWIAEAEGRRAVAHDELPAVVSEPPPFAVVLHRALHLEGL